jgi:uncharacterized protein
MFASVRAGKIRTSKRILASAVLVVLTSFLGSHVAHGASTATVTECDVSITADDGTVLRASVLRPATPGRYPVVITATVYGKGCPTSSPFADAGYAVVNLDDRGTGTSQGVIDAWGARNKQDYANVIDWIQAQPWANGKIAATGCSAPGQSSVLFALADQSRVDAGKPRAVYTVWADSAFADTLRDGWIGPGGATPWKGTLLAGAGQSNLTHDASYTPVDPPWLIPEWTTSYYNSWLGRVYVDRETDGPSAFYGPEANDRDLELSASSIRIPIVLTASWADATTLASAQSRFFSRLVHSQKRVLFESPGGHCGTTQWATLGYGNSHTAVQQAWFDRWLKGVSNGIDKIPSVNFYPLDGSKWIHDSVFPLRNTRWTNYYLDGDPAGNVLTEGSLATSRPAVVGSDTLINGVKAGAPAKGLAPRPNFPAPVDDSATLRYTSAPLTSNTLLAGPITAQLSAGFDRSDGALAVGLWDIAPDGTRTMITIGHLRASNRAIDPSRTEYGPNGIVIRPYHPLTLAAKQVISGTNSYLIEVETSSFVFQAGHQIRVTVGFAEPSTELPLILATEIEGETMHVVHGGPLASTITLPLIPA